MEREAIKQLFLDNYIGREELIPLMERLGLNVDDIVEQPISQKYSDSVLQKAASEGYILIWCPQQVNGQEITLRYLRDHFGLNPDVSEPCFYNQDWYLQETFMDFSLNSDWYLIKKDVFEDTRAVQPLDLKNRGLSFPPAILCAFTFLTYYFAKGQYLWYHDFVWCSDVDHNGDRVYVGKYHDIDGANKNGFSIHRHLALRQCYGSVNCL